MVVRLANNANGFITHSFANDPWQDCNDHVRQRLGWPQWRPGDGRERRVPPARQRVAIPSNDDHERRQRRKARWLWRMSEPAPGTIVEAYLRGRGITAPPPATVRFLPPLKPGHHPAMVAAFGLTEEVEGEMVPCGAPAMAGRCPDGWPAARTADDAPSETRAGAMVMSVDDASAVHLTYLKPDGGGKADAEPDKIAVGSPGGVPIVLAPMNDLMGLAITEGVEDALSVHMATGLGAWAAGSASFMPNIAPAIESLMVAREYDASPDCITVFADDDAAGRHHAHDLVARLTELSTRLAGPDKRHFEILLRETVR